MEEVGASVHCTLATSFQLALWNTDPSKIMTGLTLSFCVGVWSVICVHKFTGMTPKIVHATSYFLIEWNYSKLMCTMQNGLIKVVDWVKPLI